MKIDCPQCHKAFEVPDQWSGKAVRCRSCNHAFRLVPSQSAKGGSEASPLDALARLEQAQIRPEEEHFEAQEFEGALPTVTATTAQSQTAGPLARPCPHCGKPVRILDEYSEVLCSHCQNPVPALKGGESLVGTQEDQARLRRDRQRAAAAGFYDGFLAAFVYPLPAVINIAAGMGIAAISIFLPISILLAFAIGSGLNPITEASDVTWIKPLLSILFLAEAVYFGGVGYYLLLDAIRATGLGLARPPELTWNLTSVGTALSGYVGLAAWYLVIGLGVMYLANAGEFRLPATLEDFKQYTSPAYIAVFAVVTFMVPMNVIGMASGRLFQGFNPYRIVRSIAQTFGHYVFLFLMVCLYLIVYGGLMAWIVGWASERVLLAIEAYGAEGSQKFVDVAVGLGAWSILIGVGLYFAYVMGRLLGLFVRSFKKQLCFDL